MAQLQAIALKTEVSGYIVNAILNAVPNYESKIKGICAENNINQFETENWFDIKDVLNTFREISKQFGPHILFSIGKHLAKENPISEYFSSLEDALSNLDNMHRFLHRGGELGYYKLLSYSKETKEANIECRNPYPCYIDRGILTNLAVRFKPEGASLILVEMDTNRPNKLAGCDRSYYNILWI